MILLADTGCKEVEKLKKPFKLMSDHLKDNTLNIYSIGKSHFPIPCLNGNMLYLHEYFQFYDKSMIDGVVDFFYEYQRFDDGRFKTPSQFPYCSNRTCYGAHTCYWGVVKLLKGLSFIPEKHRSPKARNLLARCIDYILLHEVCYSSHQKDRLLHSQIEKLTFPNLYQSDFLEILWLLKREKVQSEHLNRALNLLKSKRQADNSWRIDRIIRNLIIPMGIKNGVNRFISERAREVLDYYSKV
jgi:hypothetical protein